MAQSKPGYIQQDCPYGTVREAVWACNKQLEIGIILDVSVSISGSDFVKVKTALTSYLQRFNIAPQSMRVSLIPFENDIHPQKGFNLSDNRDNVLKHVHELPHIGILEAKPNRTNLTNTSKAIEYMRTNQLSLKETRAGIPRVCLVLTDGNSQEWSKTADEASKARGEGIKMYAIGFGENIGMNELNRIAGHSSRVKLVANFDQLETVLIALSEEVCESTVRVKPVELQEKDIYFVFSKVELGFKQTELVINFIEQVVTRSKLTQLYRWGIVSGVCPDDAGFNLVDNIQSRLAFYRQHHLTAIIDSITKISCHAATYNENAGNCDLAILIVNQHGLGNLQENVDNLKYMGAEEVIIWNMSGSPLDIYGSKIHNGQGVEAAVTFCLENLIGWTDAPKPVRSRIVV